MDSRKIIIGGCLILAVLCEAVLVFMLSHGIQRAVNADRIPAWGTTLDISILALGAPLFILLLGYAILWMHDKRRRD